MQTQIFKGRANYEPNSLNEAGEVAGPRESPKAGFATAATTAVEDNPAPKLRTRSPTFADHYSQARLFYRSQTPPEQAHIASAIVFELSKCELEHVRKRVLASLRNVDEDLAARIAAGLAMPLPTALPPAMAPIDMPPSPALSILQKFQPTLKGRKVGLLFDEGSNKSDIDKVKAAVEQAGGTVFLVAPKVGDIKVDRGTLKADGQLAGSPSVLFDAIAVVLTKDAARKLSEEACAVDFVRDAFGHLKAIGVNAEARPLLEKAGVVPDEGVTDLGKAFIKAASTRFFEREPTLRTLA
jgi:catalase